MFSTADFASHRPSRRNSSTSPVRRATAPGRTPQKRSAKLPSYYPVTPSPLKRRTMPVPTFDDEDDDNFFSSPKIIARKENTARPRSEVFASEEDDNLFLAAPSSVQSRSLFPPSSSPMPMRTPIKQTPHVFHTPSRPALTVKPTNSPVATTTLGMKRKPTAMGSATPERPYILTPLTVTSTRSDAGDSEAFGFDRLAPLPAPSFLTRTPQTRAETEQYLKNQEDSMGKLKLGDRDPSGEESGYDSGTEVNGQRSGGSIFLDDSSKKLPQLALLISKSLKKDEVAEDISPGGHVNKRRARSRPVSAELLAATPVPSKDKQKLAFPTPILNAGKTPGSVAFPSYSAMRDRRTSASSTSSVEPGSPPPRRRLRSGTASRSQTQANQRQLSRHDSATIFFGPVINQPEPRKKKASDAMSIDVPGERPKAMTRHSYAGDSRRECDPEEERFFSSPPDTSFVLSAPGSPVKESRAEVEKLQTKFRPRDSGIMVGDDSDDDFCQPATRLQKPPLIMPCASGSLSSVQSESDGEALVTPCFGPGPGSGWPSIGIANHDDDLLGGVDSGVDAFIIRTLATGSKPSAHVPGEAKKAPGTPVKKIKTSHLMQRPWQSAVASKVTYLDFEEPREGGGKDKRAKPRKSLPAAFPTLGRDAPRRRNFARAQDNEEDEASPTARKDSNNYGGIGLGRPSGWFAKGSNDPMARWMRRGSSSEASSMTTPTRTPARGTSPPIDSKYRANGRLFDRLDSDAAVSRGHKRRAWMPRRARRTLRGLVVFVTL